MGNSVIILPGIIIGSDVVIGSGAVVTKDIPSNSVYGGNPAKLICSYETYKEKTTQLLSEVPLFDETYTSRSGIDKNQKDEMKKSLSNSIGFVK